MTLLLSSDPRRGLAPSAALVGWGDRHAGLEKYRREFTVGAGRNEFTLQARERGARAARGSLARTAAAAVPRSENVVVPPADAALFFPQVYPSEEMLTSYLTALPAHAATSAPLRTIMREYSADLPCCCCSPGLPPTPSFPPSSPPSLSSSRRPAHFRPRSALPRLRLAQPPPLRGHLHALRGGVREGGG